MSLKKKCVNLLREIFKETRVQDNGELTIFCGYSYTPMQVPVSFSKHSHTWMCQMIPRRKARKTGFNSVSMWSTLGKVGLSYSKLPHLHQPMHSARPPLYTSCRSSGLVIFELVFQEPQVSLALLPKFRGEAAPGMWMRSQWVAGLRFYE